MLSLSSPALLQEDCFAVASVCQQRDHLRPMLGQPLRRRVCRSAIHTKRTVLFDMDGNKHKARARRASIRALDVVANAEFLDECTILVDVALLDVLQKSAALADELHEAAA